MITSVSLPPERNREIDITVAAKILGLSSRWVRVMCRDGVFKTAIKPGMGERAHWKISHHEVVWWKLNPNKQKP